MGAKSKKKKSKSKKKKGKKKCGNFTHEDLKSLIENDDVVKKFRKKLIMDDELKKYMTESFEDEMMILELFKSE